MPGRSRCSVFEIPSLCWRELLRTSKVPKLHLQDEGLLANGAWPGPMESRPSGTGFSTRTLVRREGILQSPPLFFQGPFEGCRFGANSPNPGD